jgi:hypothetical protein
MQPYPVHDNFIEALGTTFQVMSASTGPQDLVLSSVTPASPVSPDDSNRPLRSFSLLFQDSGEPVLPQRIYALEHARLGIFELFLVPVGPDRASGCMRYEAIFN